MYSARLLIPSPSSSRSASAGLLVLKPGRFNSQLSGSPSWSKSARTVSVAALATVAREALLIPTETLAPVTDSGRFVSIIAELVTPLTTTWFGMATLFVRQTQRNVKGGVPLAETLKAALLP